MEYNNEKIVNILMEQPFYRPGMSTSEIKKEEEYLNSNLNDFFHGRYIPLWKQRLIDRGYIN